jgi:regulator of replication initiation timing
MAALGLCVVAAAGAQDARLEERINVLSSKIDDFNERLELQRQETEHLRQDLAALQEQLAKLAPTLAPLAYATNLAEAIRTVDRRRADDTAAIVRSFQVLREDLARQLAPLTNLPTPTQPQIIHHTPPPPIDPDPTPTGPPAAPDTGFWYPIEKGDTLSAIIQACREKGLKVTREQILKANPKLKPNVLIPKAKIWIPVEKGA